MCRAYGRLLCPSWHPGVSLNLPHDSWAEVCDLAYQEEFGDLYQHITDITLAAIARIAPADARIVDFGAGTGRLAVPLAAAGYRVTAVEPSSAMLDKIRRSTIGAQVSCVPCKMQDFTSDDHFDLALCVFTVVIYLLDEESLNRAFHAAAGSLMPGGHLLIDVPSRMTFSNRRVTRHNFQRTVNLTPLDGSLYLYEDHIAVERDGQTRPYSDTFRIRCWEVEDVITVAQANGFVVEEALTSEFAMTGSHYLLFRRF